MFLVFFNSLSRDVFCSEKHIGANRFLLLGGVLRAYKPKTCYDQAGFQGAMLAWRSASAFELQNAKQM